MGRQARAIVSTRLPFFVWAQDDDRGMLAVSRSDEVRDFYERMPYPAPLASLPEDRNLYGNPARNTSVTSAGKRMFKVTRR